MKSTKEILDSIEAALGILTQTGTAPCKTRCTEFKKNYCSVAERRMGYCSDKSVALRFKFMSREKPLFLARTCIIICADFSRGPMLILKKISRFTENRSNLNCQVESS